MMARETPTLGYPSRTAAALALRAEGLTEAAIAEKVGVSRNAISGLLANARDGRDAPQLGRGTSRGNDDVLAAKRAGIMLSHEVARPIHRPTSDGSMRVIDLKLPEAQFGKLIEMARKASLTPSAYANNLFQAAYSARVKPPGHRDLDEAVGQPGAAPASDDAAKWQEMAASLGQQLEAALAANEAHAASAARWRTTAEEREVLWCDAAAERDIAVRQVAELQETMAGATVIANQAGALLREKDAELAEAREIQEDQGMAITEPTARVARLKNGPIMQDSSVMEIVPVALTPLQLRQAQALKACGNTLREISAEIGAPVELVRDALGGR